MADFKLLNYAGSAGEARTEAEANDAVLAERCAALHTLRAHHIGVAVRALAALRTPIRRATVLGLRKKRLAAGRQYSQATVL